MCSNEQLYFHDHWVQVVFFCLYAAIFIFGVGGNLVVIGVILGNKHMRTTINLYLLNLATSDIIMSVFASSKLMGRWRLLGHGDWMCKVTHSSMMLSVCMSTFTLAAIAVNRFLAVFYPFSSRNNSLTRTIIIIVCIDLAAIIISLPLVVMFIQVDWDPNLNLNSDREDLKFEGGMICGIDLDKWSLESILVYNSFLKISQFVIPCTIIVICYTSIMIKLRKRAQKRRSESLTAQQREEEDARNKRMNKMLILVTVIFGICWFPAQLSQVIIAKVDIFCWKLRELTMCILHVLAMSSACYNPFLYCFMNTAFKEAFTKLCPCARKTAATKNQDREGGPRPVEGRIQMEIMEIKQGTQPAPLQAEHVTATTASKSV